MKTKFVKVAVKNRLPDKEGFYFVETKDLQQQGYYFIPTNPWISEEFVFTIEYWYGEVRDNEDDLKQIVNNINLQKVGKLINLPLGHDISPKICPWIEKSIEEKNELCDLLQEAVNHLGEVKWEDYQTETLGNFCMNAQAAIFRIKNNAPKLLDDDK